jgi:spermidine synthase/predicted MFS family arabinose efflux permease
MPALIYQIVWQRALFSLYGTNIESITLIVADFMLGLGIGALLGSRLTEYSRPSPLLLYALFEIIAAAFGSISLPLIHHLGLATLQYSLAYTSLIAFLLLLIPTACMGASLPLLVEHLQRRQPDLGRNTAILYSANTFGATAACLLLAFVLMALLGQQKVIWLAVGLNLITGLGALAFYQQQPHPLRLQLKQKAEKPWRKTSRWLILSLLLGFCALSYEMLWIHLLAFASGTRAPIITATLAFYLAGIAYGSLICHRLLHSDSSAERLYPILLFTLISSSAVIPCLTWFYKSSYGHTHLLLSLLLICLGALGFGMLLPYIAHLVEQEEDQGGAATGRLYFCNIIGATLGTLVTGFYLMNHLSTAAIAWLLFVFMALLSLWAMRQNSRTAQRPRHIIFICSVLLIALALPIHSTTIYQPLLSFNQHKTPKIKYIDESNAGTITVLENNAVFGNGVYDGYFNIDPNHNINGIHRAYLIPLFKAQPQRVLMVGLSSGSWAQVVANNPEVKKLDIIEINPGYLKLYKHYPAIQSLRDNNKVKIYIDDGRRWLNKHPSKQYDLIVMNTTWHWRAFSSLLLSQEMLNLVKRHLKPGGQVYYNTTFSTRAIKTALDNFQHVLGVSDFVIASDQPINLNPHHLIQILNTYRINGKRIFPNNSKGQHLITQLSKLPLILKKPTHINIAQPGIIQPSSLPKLSSQQTLSQLTKHERIITDNNMGDEWRRSPF